MVAVGGAILCLTIVIRFMLRHCDSLLIEAVPPIDLQKLSVFRGVLAKQKRQSDDDRLANEEKLLGG